MKKNAKKRKIMMQKINFSTQIITKIEEKCKLKVNDTWTKLNHLRF